MKKTKGLLAVLLVMVMTLSVMPQNALAAGNGDLALEYETRDSYVVGDTIKITMTATVYTNFSNTRVQLNLNRASAPCYLELVEGSVYVDGMPAGKVTSGTAINNSTNKYYIRSNGLLAVSLGDLSAGDTRVVTFDVKIAEGSGEMALNMGSLLHDNGASVITTSPVTTSTPLKHPVKEAGTKTSENLASADGKYYVGDTIKYSVTASNTSAAESSLWEELTVTDTLPDGVTFVDGSVEIDGTAAVKGTGEGQYTYDESSRTLTVYLSDLGKNSECTVTFRVKIDADAYGKYIVNTAKISGTDNGRQSTPLAIDVSDITGFTVEPEPGTYTVTYDPNGGGGSAYTVTESVGDGHEVLPDTDSNLGFDRQNYIFLGWSTDPSAGYNEVEYRRGDTIGDSAADGDAITLYAVWIEGGPTSGYVVVYDANGGTGGYADTVLTSGSSYTVKEQSDTGITCDGYTFLGWNTQPNGNGTNYDPDDVIIITNNMTLYAQWKLVSNLTYAVNYDANGGTGSYADADLTSGSSYTVKEQSDTEITRDGYSFKGWNTKADGSGTSYATGGTFMITENVTLYAQWEKTSSDGTTDTGNTTSTTVGSPKTGDNSNMGLWITLLCVSMAGAVCLLWTVVRRRKRYGPKH